MRDERKAEGVNVGERNSDRLSGCGNGRLERSSSSVDWEEMEVREGEGEADIVKRDVIAVRAGDVVVGVVVIDRAWPLALHFHWDASILRGAEGCAPLCESEIRRLERNAPSHQTVGDNPRRKYICRAG